MNPLTPTCRSVWALVVLTGACLAGCSSSPASRHYVLAPVATGDSENSGQLDVSLRITQIQLPRYLSAAEIVTRSSEHALELATFDLWGEPLETGFLRTLRSDLAALLPSASVVVDRAEANRVDFGLAVFVERFDVDQHGVAHLEARWVVSKSSRESDDRRLSASHIERGVEGNGYQAIVQALSQSVADLAREIAAALRTWDH